MPVVTRLAYRKPARLVSEEKNEDKGPRPISMIGYDRSTQTNSFSQGQNK